MHPSYYCFNSVVSLVLTIAISSRLCTRSAGSKIESIGKYSSNDFQWAEGVPELKFQLQPNTACKSSCVENWQFMNINISFLTLAVTSEKLYNKYCSFPSSTGLINTTTNETFKSPEHEPKFILECFFMEENATSIYHILEHLEAGDYNLSVAANTEISGEIKIRNCPDLSDSAKGFLKISDSANAKFNSTVSYKCTNDSILVADNDFTEHLVYERRCQFNASWTEMRNVECSYAPSTSVKNCSDTSATFTSATVLTNETITLCCAVKDYGNPNATRLNYFVKKSDGSSYKNFSDIALNDNITLQLIPELDKARITCQGLNNYTLYFKNDAGISQPFILDVQFGPKSEESYSEVSSSLYQQAILTFTFTANPQIMDSNVNLTFLAEGTDRKVTKEGGILSKGGSQQTFTYTVQNVTAGDFGLYLLNVSSNISVFHPLILKRNLTGEMAIEVTTIVQAYTSGDTTGSPPKLSIVAIIVPVIGVFIIILIVIFLCKIWQRKKQDKSLVKEERENPVYEASSIDAADREEKINPLYGSSSGAARNEKEDRINPLYGSAGSSDNAAKKKKGKNEKEERKNPLYASAGEDVPVVEDAYAEIEKKKDKKEKSHDNAVFSVEPSSDTYAEVKKPKKDKPVISQPEATYAEVQKKKGNKKDSGLHGTVDEAP